ncbi:transcription factor E4F1-like isoform X2 [Gigantopelta aegis]|nr:transcription factor E4F1-like isoform X2 [Gigantopelta aegis]
MEHDNLKVTYSRSHIHRRLILPQLSIKEELHPQNGECKVKKRRKRKKAVDVSVELITERNTYGCNKCDRKFNREASLRWHIKCDHTVDGDSDSDENKADSTSYVDDDDDADPSYKKQRVVKVENSTERPYNCDLCGCTFKEHNVLKTHMLTHTNKRGFVCRAAGCTYAFKTKGSLTRHMRRHTGDRPYKCQKCGRKFSESGALTRHLRSRNPCTSKSDQDLPRYGMKWNFIPNIPAAMANAGHALQPSDGADIARGEANVPNDTDHQLTVTIKTEVVDSEKSATEVPLTDGSIDTVVTTGSIEEGEIIVMEDMADTLEDGEEPDYSELTPTQCKVCKEDCGTFDTLRLHLRTHLADTPFRCGLCHFVAERRDELQAHMTTLHQTQLKTLESGTVVGTAIEPAQSNNGGPTNINKDAQVAVKQLLELPSPSLEEDENSEKNESTRQLHKCPVCYRAFRGHGYLRQHMKSHIGDRPHKCEYCDKSFTSKDTLNKHLFTHSEDRNYKCGECGKLFKRISHVREHLKIHTNDRPYTCQMCDKSFKTHNALKVHMRTHNSILPYLCKFCRRRFREKGSLARHLRMHTGERPYKCNRCGRGFAEHGTLNRHLKAKVRCTSLGNVISDEGEEYPTVLAEFSSVVADTQEYILPEGVEIQEATPEEVDEYAQATEFVVVHTTDLDETALQNIEIITEGDIDQSILNQMSDKSSYVFYDTGDNNIRVLDSRTGQEMSVIQSDLDHVQTITMIPQGDNEIEAVAMAPLAEDEPDAVQQAMVAANVMEQLGVGGESKTQSDEVNNSLVIQAE